MSRTETITIRDKRRYRVDVSRIAAESVEARRRGFGVTPAGPHRAEQGALVGRLHDGGSRITAEPRSSDPTDLVNRYTANHYEMGPFPDISQIDAVRRDLKDRADTDPVTYEHSGRRSYANMVPIAATEETDGVLMSLHLERRPFADSDPQARRSYGVNRLASWIHSMRSPVEQLAQIDASLADYVGTPEYPEMIALRRQVERLQLEGFETETWNRAQQDLAFVPPGLAPGAYCPSFSGGAIYHSFDPLDTANFITSRQATTVGAPATPWLTVGDGYGTVYDLILEPKLPQIRFTWVAVYVVIVLFAPPIITAEVNLGSYCDRLPLGFAFREEPEQSINDTVMSAWMRQSNRYALALRQDLGAQVFSRFFFKLLMNRVDGLWEYFTPALNAGDLAGIVDVRRGGHDSRRDRYYVYRRTAVPGGVGFDGVEGYGSLGVAGEVQPHTKGQPTFAGGRMYGPF